MELKLVMSRLMTMQTREERIVRMREYRKKNIEQLRAYDRQRYKDNKEKRKATVQAWRDANPDKVKASIMSWQRRNKAKKNALVQSRHVRFKQARPKWLSKEQSLAIVKMYFNCPKGHHVDHIIPINGEIVSGLHVPWNLQYLSAFENLSKGNKSA